MPLLFRVVGGGEVVVGHEVLLLVGLVLGVRGPEAIAVGRVPRDAGAIPAYRKDKYNEGLVCRVHDVDANNHTFEFPARFRRHGKWGMNSGIREAWPFSESASARSDAYAQVPCLRPRRRKHDEGERPRGLRLRRRDPAGEEPRGERVVGAHRLLREAGRAPRPRPGAGQQGRQVPSNLKQTLILSGMQNQLSAGWLTY